MCLTVAGRVVSVDEHDGTAFVEEGGRRWEVSLAPIVLDGGRVNVGDWVLVHTGLAVAVLDEQEAHDLLAPIPRTEQMSGGRPETNPAPERTETRRAGIALAAVTACVSGVAVFVNGYGVRRFPDPTTYTTAKNLVAALLLGAVAASAVRSADGFTRPRHRVSWLGVAAVALIGGSIPFVLFFEGLARATSTDAAFLHKTLVVWVAVLAVPLLRERVGVPHVLAIALLMAGQLVLAGGAASLRPGTGELMVLAATLLWSAEVIVAKRMLAGVAPLTLATARMGGGVLVLLVWTAMRGELGVLTGLDRAAWGWAVATGALLFVYVGTWYTALARAQAVDVTAVLVFGAVITAVLEVVVKGVSLPEPTGLALIAGGTALVLAAATRGRAAPLAVTAS